MKTTSDGYAHAERFAQLAVALLVASVAGFRLAGRDNDYLAYQAIYSQVLEQHYANYEWLFVRLIEVSGHVLHLPFAGFLVLCSFIAVVPKFWAFQRYAANFWVAVVGYVMIYWVLHEMTQIRSGMALGFAALAIGLVYEKRWLWAIITYGIAVLIHTSLLVMAPFLMFPGIWREVSIRRPIVVLSSFALIMLAMRFYGPIAAIVDRYVGNHGVGYGEQLLSIRLVLCTAISVIGLSQLKEAPPTIRPYIWMGLWASILFISFFWDAAYANRLFELAGFFMLFWIGSLRGWPGRISVTLFLGYCAITLINYYRFHYLVPF